MSNMRPFDRGKMPWQMPNMRTFDWWVSVFKVLIKGMAREGWYLRSHLWNLIFLQRINGSFELSEHLATVLKAGEPLELLEVNPIAPYDYEALVESMPKQLLQVFLDAEEASDVTPKELWATILVLEQLKSYPFSFTENPWDPPAHQVTVRGRSEMFLNGHCEQYPQLEVIMPELQQLALALTEDWTAAHEQRIEALYEAMNGAKTTEKGAAAPQAPMRQRWQQVVRHARRYWSLAKRNFVWVAKAHPICAIYLVKATEPFSRAERILIQTNTFILMLFFTVWFYYSKSVNCCIDLRSHLGCADHTATSTPCLGFAFCSALADGQDDGLLPEELAANFFLCTAFPQSTFAGRIWVIAIIVGILTPTTMLLSQLFMMASDSAIPGHWGTFPTKCLAHFFGPGPTSLIQTVAFTLYALFFNLEKFNKAIALALIAFLTLVMKPQHMQAAIRVVVGTVYWSFRQCQLSVRRLGQLVGLYSSTPLAADAHVSLLAQVRLVSPLEAELQKVAYGLIMFGWSMVAWLLFTFATQIREIMGGQAETELIANWAIVLVVEIFGKEAIKLIAVRVSVNFVMETLESMLLGMTPAVRWHEKYIMQVAAANAVGNDDTGDQDLGDDVDADGGDEFDGGDADGGGGMDI
ncbi:hypothetical protein CYMTET_10853 [Cymbomonas tetramitiformis]|uniref:Uncharacterized protein n=1 Tax=Cymbomonas tetramitiformis TaxID=36881 RepID=A0AAE0GNN3_9CHLO|nr:hypothetical protein CYMTET_10853 [Cymbomonas tetramitiformis]